MIKLIVLDVDGCLTDGKIIYASDGSETKSFNVKDGLAIATWIRMGHHVAIITGRESKIVKRRADELGIKLLHQGIKDKETLLKSIATEQNIASDEIAAIGDDLNDFNMLKFVGKSYTPANGVEDIKDIVSVVLSVDGGDGAVREMIEDIINFNDQKKEFLSFWI
ncbi:MAG: HAD-IIIA family hydrolase [Campylobacterota bacterium]|nr:HAD-IIIA family hydrolase [Campylobacterota bacterium]